MATLSDLVNQFNTPLTTSDEKRYQAWKATLPANLQNESDYDLRGAWKANAQAAANGHLPDTWKKPNHYTFSKESQYSTPENVGGTWADGGDGNWVYWGSPANTRYHSLSDLAQYFQQYEPNSTVVLPLDWRLR